MGDFLQTDAASGHGAADATVACWIPTRRAVPTAREGRSGSVRILGRKPCDAAGHPILETVMSVKLADGDVIAAVKGLQHARGVCAHFRPAHSPLTPIESAQRARIIETVVRTRKLLRWLQACGEGLARDRAA